jgi:hypothetical protein
MSATESLWKGREQATLGRPTARLSHVGVYTWVSPDQVSSTVLEKQGVEPGPSASIHQQLLVLMTSIGPVRIKVDVDTRRIFDSGNGTICSFALPRHNGTWILASIACIGTRDSGPASVLVTAINLQIGHQSLTPNSAFSSSLRSTSRTALSLFRFSHVTAAAYAITDKAAKLMKAMQMV